MANSPEHMAKMREKAAQRRAEGPIEHLDPIEKARKYPNSLRKAVTAKCWDCIGRGTDPKPRWHIANCVCTDCPLYPVRPWQHLYETALLPTEQA